MKAYEPKSVVVAVPTPGNPHAPTASTLEHLCRDAGIPPVKYIIARVSAADSKSRAVYWFLHETDAEFLIIVDHDVIPPFNFLDIVNHDLDIVGAPYIVSLPDLCKTPIPGVFTRAPNGMYMPIPDVFSQTGLVECDMMVGGAMCYRRSVLEKVKPAFLFHFDEWGRMEKTEDVHFCIEAKKQGYRIFADYSLMCEHHQQANLWDLMTRIRDSIKLSIVK